MNDSLFIPYRDGLETDRLSTRFLRAEDAALWLEYCADPIATKYTLMPDKTPVEMAQSFIHYTLDRYAAGTLGMQALICKDTGNFIGMCGLLVQDPGGKAEIEVGYHLLRKYWGMGYATEAAQMFRDYGFEHSSVASIVSIIDPMNEPSKKVADRNGMTLSETEVLFRAKRYDIHRIYRSDWEKMKRV